MKHLLGTSFFLQALFGATVFACDNTKNLQTLVNEGKLRDVPTLRFRLAQELALRELCLKDDPSDTQAKEDLVAIRELVQSDLLPLKTIVKDNLAKIQKDLEDSYELLTESDTPSHLEFHLGVYNNLGSLPSKKILKSQLGIDHLESRHHTNYEDSSIDTLTLVQVEKIVDRDTQKDVVDLKPLIRKSREYTNTVESIKRNNLIYKQDQIAFKFNVKFRGHMLEINSLDIDLENEGDALREILNKNPPIWLKLETLTFHFQQKNKVKYFSFNVFDGKAWGHKVDILPETIKGLTSSDGPQTMGVWFIIPATIGITYALIAQSTLEVTDVITHPIQIAARKKFKKQTYTTTITLDQADRNQIDAVQNWVDKAIRGSL